MLQGRNSLLPISTHPRIDRFMLGSLPDFRRRLLKWYDKARRDLPWRAQRGTAGTVLDPYHVLVSEAMLQQTQVATVIPYYHRFLQRFPTIADLAAANEQDVLRLWQGLGYYSRARNLQRAAQTVMRDHAGHLPRTRDELLTLPGVGRYTAGAVASIAFGCRAPILDGNVIRVLCRLDKVESEPRDKQTLEVLWARAEEVLPKSRCGDFNSALMELGATICTPRNPQCLLCPVREHCAAFAAGLQEKIPPPKKAKPTPLHRRVTYCIARPDGRWLIEQRPAKGRWAGMWQFLTLVVADDAETHPPLETSDPVSVGTVQHSLTHRRYVFDVRICRTSNAKASSRVQPPRVWASLDELAEYPLPRPHVRIAEMLRNLPAVTARLTRC
jgi:A/G-specific adenine glycosylase